METTRVNKYKNYRSSIINETAPDIKNPNDVVKDDKIKNTFSGNTTTSTLSYNEVYGKIHEDDMKQKDEREKKMRRDELIKKSLIIGGVVVVIVLLVVTAIILFGK